MIFSILRGRNAISFPECTTKAGNLVITTTISYLSDRHIRTVSQQLGCQFHLNGRDKGFGRFTRHTHQATTEGLHTHVHLTGYVLDAITPCRQIGIDDINQMQEELTIRIWLLFPNRLLSFGLCSHFYRSNNSLTQLGNLRNQLLDTTTGTTITPETIG